MIPLAEKDVVYHYRVKTGSQESAVATFKGYPTKELRIGVVANLRADEKIDLSARRRTTSTCSFPRRHGDAIPEFCEENQPDCVESHGTLVDTQAELFRSTPFLPTLGNLDRKIRPKSDGPEKPAYEIPRVGLPCLFALPGKEWILELRDPRLRPATRLGGHEPHR